MIFKKQILITLILTFCYVTTAQAGILDGRVEPLTRQEAQEIRANTLKNCGVDELKKEEDEIDPSDTEAFEKFFYKSKCAIACGLKMLGATIDDKQLNKEVIKYVPDIRLMGGKVKCPYEQFYEKCSNIEDSDRCLYGWKVFDCMMSLCTKINEEDKQ